jgi:hypothetical protein
MEDSFQLDLKQLPPKDSREATRARDLEGLELWKTWEERRGHEQEVVLT